MEKVTLIGKTCGDCLHFNSDCPSPPMASDVACFGYDPAPADDEVSAVTLGEAIEQDDPIIYSIRRSDITGVVADDEDYTGKMTPAVIAEVERQLFKMDFSDMADTIRIMIDDAIDGLS